jgi:hypothetical protein
MDEKQPENLDYLKYLDSMTANHAKYTHEIKSRVVIAEAEFNWKKTLFARKLDLNLREKLVKCYVWTIALYGAESWQFGE